MHWTTNRPTANGYYWLIEADDDPCIVYVSIPIGCTDGDVYYSIASGSVLLASFDGKAKWYGPLKAPKEGS